MQKKRRPDPHNALAALRRHHQQAAKGKPSHVGRPTALATVRTTAIQEIPVPEIMKRQQAAGTVEPVLRAFRFGNHGNVLIGHDPVQGWHLSISFPDRYPTWDEIAEARYRLLPDTAQMAVILPPKTEYVNLHPNCFHLYEVVGRKNHLQALETLRLADDALRATILRTGTYDWNADPDNITLKQGQAFQAIEETKKRT